MFLGDSSERLGLRSTTGDPEHTVVNASMPHAGTLTDARAVCQGAVRLRVPSRPRPGAATRWAAASLSSSSGALPACSRCFPCVTQWDFLPASACPFCASVHPVVGALRIHIVFQCLSLLDRSPRVFLCHFCVGSCPSVLLTHCLSGSTPLWVTCRQSPSSPASSASPRAPA